jgi:hypothetical protein
MPDLKIQLLFNLANRRFSVSRSNSFGCGVNIVFSRAVKTNLFAEDINPSRKLPAVSESQKVAEGFLGFLPSPYPVTYSIKHICISTGNVISFVWYHSTQALNLQTDFPCRDVTSSESGSHQSGVARAYLSV